MLVDLRRRGMTGKSPRRRCTGADHGQQDAVPNDPQKPWVTSGIRIGTPALTTRGFGPEEMRLIAA